MREIFCCKPGKTKWNKLLFLQIQVASIIAFYSITVDINDLQNFVDLAGSERASQTHADGARLREGCHINLSLMTLTTVIRKLRSESIAAYLYLVRD